MQQLQAFSAAFIKMKYLVDIKTRGGAQSLSSRSRQFNEEIEQKSVQVDGNCEKRQRERLQDGNAGKMNPALRLRVISTKKSCQAELEPQQSRKQGASFVFSWSGRWLSR